MITYLVDELGLPAWTRSVERWLAVDFVSILLWVIGAVLVARFVRWAAGRYSQHVRSKFESSDDIVQSEDMKHRRALVDVVAWTLIAIVVVVLLLHILSMFVPTSSLVGLSAVLGGALGFGAQRIVQDVLAGFFIIVEHQYGYGDVVNLTVTGGGEAEGTVEDVTLRVTRLRTSDGELITVPNGQMIKATNLSKDWARAVVDVPVPADADITVVNRTLREAGQSFYDDPEWHRLLLDPPQSLGVTKIELDAVTVRLVVRTLPGQQFDVGRALRAEIVMALARHGVIVTRQTPVAAVDDSGEEISADD